MGTWSDSEFDAAFKRKQDIQQQQANADTTRADATAQDVAQRPEIQARSDAAAMSRAQLASSTSLQQQGMQNQSASDVAGINARNRMDVANVGEAGANFRTGLTTSTQKSIADQSLGLDRERLAQQGAQFGQTFALDTARAQESAIQGRAQLETPEYGAPSFNPKSGSMESGIRRPPITGLAPSPLAPLGGGSALSMESDETLKRRRAEAAGRQ